MKRILILLSSILFFLQTVHSSEPSETTDHNKIVSKSYVYLAPGIAPFIPSLQAGIRVQRNHFGFGVQFMGSYYFLAFPCEVSASFLYYKRKRESV